MKHLKQSLLAIAFVVGISVTASAQKDGDKKPPPKPPPPIIVPKDKPKDERPKKPQATILAIREEITFE